METQRLHHYLVFGGTVSLLLYLLGNVTITYFFLPLTLCPSFNLVYFFKIICQAFAILAHTTSPNIVNESEMPAEFCLSF